MSPALKQRWADNMRMSIKNHEDFNTSFTKLDKLDALSTKLTFLPFHYVQTTTDVTAYKAAEAQAIHKFKMTDPKQINDYATHVVLQTQPSYTVSNRAPIMGGTPLWRLITDIGTPSVTMFNMTSREWTRNRSEVQVKRISAQLYVLMTVSALGSIGFMMGHPGKTIRAVTGQEDKDEYLKEMALHNVHDMVDTSMPIYGRNMESILFSRNHMPNIPSLSGVMPLVRTGRAVKNRFSEDKTEFTKDDIFNALDAFTTITGHPVNAVHKVFKDLIELNPNLDPNR